MTAYFSRYLLTFFCGKAADKKRSWVRSSVIASPLCTHSLRTSEALCAEGKPAVTGLISAEEESRWKTFYYLAFSRVFISTEKTVDFGL